MPDLSDWYIFSQDKLKISIKVNTFLYNVFHILINYDKFTCCIENSVDPEQLASEEAS